MLALLMVGSVFAQDAPPEVTPEATTEIVPLSYGTPVTGSISDTTFQEAWPLSVASGDRVQVTLTRTSGNLIPDVQILDSTGTAVAQSYGADRTYATAQIADTTLPAAGDYTVQVSRYNGQDGLTSGSYSLVVTPLGTAADNPNNLTPLGEVKADTPVTGEITATHWYDLFTYNALGSDTIQVIAKRTDGTLLPTVSVLDANNTALRTGYNDGDTADSGAFDLPAAGAYTVAVSRYNDQDGDTLGTYELSVHLVGSGEDSPLLKAAAGNVTYDQELDGSISGAQWYQDWSLTADAGNTLTITVDRNGGDLQPEVALLGGSGQEITHGYTDNTYASATISRYDLAGPGNYTVRVTRKSAQTGDTAGAYALTVTLNGTGKGSPKLSEPAGDITLATPVNGEITNAKWQNYWTFTSDKAGPIDVMAMRTDGTLAPTLQVLDANNQPLTSAYPSNTEDSSEISSYNLPGPGKYIIVVGRENDQQRLTAGKYSLSVSDTPQQ
jgi:hypothetical protein